MFPWDRKMDATIRERNVFCTKSDTVINNTLRRMNELRDGHLMTLLTDIKK